jgi:epoxide hydrolase 4
MPEPTFLFRSTNSVRLHVAEAGPPDGPLVLLLHGFPEFWYGWRHQIGPLAEAGYHVVVPDQRGYNLSDKPAGVGSYALETLAADVIGLIDSYGTRPALLVGHDWGGVVAWWVATRFPERLERLAILNAPHPAAMKRHLLRDPGQMLRSWYVFAFQIPWLPEACLRWRAWRSLVQSLETTSRPGTFGESDFHHYRQAWSQPGAITSMIHWYRAGLRGFLSTADTDAKVTVPTLLIHGINDQFLGPSLMRSCLDFCTEARYEPIDNATHWVLHEEVDRVNQLLIDFLKRA